MAGISIPLRECKCKPTDVFFALENEKFRDYIEWEKYPEKKQQAAQILAQYSFAQEPEFQLLPLPDTNPILDGLRWKQYHVALGPTLQGIPDRSWSCVKEEKSPDMIHLLQFPYNGEPPRVSIIQDC